MTTHIRKASIISPSRIFTIASHTFTQLVRMKVFYFLIVLVVLLWVLQQFVFGDITGGDAASEQELRLLKSTSYFAMNMFASIMALAATSILIPKDIEDRTLYTILSKPVPRLDYLIGKLLGVLALIAISLIAMDLFLSFFLNSKTAELILRESENLRGNSNSAELIATRSAELNRLGVTANTHFASFAIFLKAAVIASIALLISTFSTSTIFTIILTILFILIGLIQDSAREIALHTANLGKETIISKISLIAAVIFPNFQFMSIDDAVIDGKTVPTAIALKITAIACFYCAIYVVLSWFTFRKKEF